MAEKCDSLPEYADYACVTRKSNWSKDVLLKDMIQSGFNDYTCVTRKSNQRKELLPRDMIQSGFNDYTCVTRKPNQSKEMMVFGEVPIIPVSHVSFIAQGHTAERKISALCKCVHSA